MHMLINGKYTCSSNALYGFRSEEAGMGGMGGKGHSHAESTPAAKAAQGQVARLQAPGKILTVSNMTDCVGPFKVSEGRALRAAAGRVRPQEASTVSCRGVCASAANS